MVRLLLSIKADLENLVSLEPLDDFEYFFKVKCNSCNETHPKLVSLNRTDEREGLKGTKANFVWKCGSCKRESSAKFDASKSTPYKAENGQYGPLLTIECRGLEFIGFDPRGIWKCVGTTGTVFNDVNLEEDEWTDYDEKAAQPVGISGFDAQFSRA